jgi:hypothetical protein
MVMRAIPSFRLLAAVAWSVMLLLRHLIRPALSIHIPTILLAITLLNILLIIVIIIIIIERIRSIDVVAIERDTRDDPHVIVIAIRHTTATASIHTTMIRIE